MKLLYKRIFIIIGVIVIIVCVFYSVLFYLYISSWSKLGTPAIYSYKIYHKKLNDSMFITYAGYAAGYGGEDAYYISNYRKSNDTYFYNPLTDYYFEGLSGDEYYFLTDSSVVLLVNIKSAVPSNFNSKIKVEQLEMNKIRKLIDEMNRSGKLINMHELFSKPIKNNK